MPRPNPLVVSIAAVLALSASQHVAATTLIKVNINDLENAIYLPSNEASYNDWAAKCPNVDVGSSCGYGDADGPQQNTDTLFFWGLGTQITGAGTPASPYVVTPGNQFNTKLQATWTSEQQSAQITSYRYLSLKTDAGTTDLLGPTAGLADVPLGAFTFTFGAPTQGQGVFVASGRDTGDADTSTFLGGGTARISGVVVDSQADLLAAGNINTAGIKSTVNTMDVLAPTTTFYQDLFAGNAYAVPHPRNVQNTVGTPAVLQTDNVLQLELFRGSAAPDEDHPVYMASDAVIQFNPPATGVAEAGMIIQGLPDESSSAVYSRPDATTLTADINVRAGTPAITGITYQVHNQGGAGSQIGDGTGGSYGQAGIQGAANGLAGVDFGATTDTASLLVGEQTAERSFDFTAQTLDLTNTTRITGAIEQEILGGTVAQNTQVINANTVGPILGVTGQATPDTPAATLDYGSTIDLGTLNIGTCANPSLPACSLTRTLTISNLFGTDLGDLTDLTIANIGITRDGFTENPDGIFSVVGFNLADDGTVEAGATDDFEITIRFQPGAGDEEIFSGFSLYFLTDMNELLGDVSDLADPKNNGWKTFALRGTRLNQTASTPLPAPLALLAVGLVGLAGFRARRNKRLLDREVV